MGDLSIGKMKKVGEFLLQVVEKVCFYKIVQIL